MVFVLEVVLSGSAEYSHFNKGRKCWAALLKERCDIFRNPLISALSSIRDNKRSSAWFVNGPIFMQTVTKTGELLLISWPACAALFDPHCVPSRVHNGSIKSCAETDWIYAEQLYDLRLARDLGLFKATSIRALSPSLLCCVFLPFRTLFSQFCLLVLALPPSLFMCFSFIFPLRSVLTPLSAARRRVALLVQWR